ncbi:Serine/threonine-protein kinase PknD [Paraburkholderia aspalathi]|uniref:protein kinase domain-containing protein n=1 Tax=Paraburkholderia aspalathi TaxID=1324617 RepID=UPI001B1D523F|nr:protein kinase [Paraburkholderia aspalathi]CAE6872434.1 Serine/threonine-protein kinase PknD [Paraburkholderia aspalathi]
MGKENLVKYFKSTHLETDVGIFKFIKQVGQGGNALVCAFEKGDKVFAIKFLEHGNARKLARFVDEFFSAAQLIWQKNIVRSYHFDSVTVESEVYSLIVMKLYDASLRGLGSISGMSDEEKAINGWRLARAILAGLHHLHVNGIIHRDLKPENIFFEKSTDTYVIGDLGIAHFSDEFPRQASTKEGERLANYSFSPPDQIDPSGPPHPVWDIYAVGQILNWYLYNELIRGDGRKSYSGENKDLAILDAIVHRCVQNDPKQRFQSVEEISVFETERRRPVRDVFARLYDLDEVVRSSVPRIKDFYETADQQEITRFLGNFSERCNMDEFWFITSSGGDNTVEEFIPLEQGRWLLQKQIELKVEKLIIYRHDGLYKSLFILITEADEPFEWVDFDGAAVPRGDTSEWTLDSAVIFSGNFMNPSEFENGFYEHNSEVHRVEYGQAPEHFRNLRPDALMIVPDRTGPSRVDWTINRDLLTKIAQDRTVKSEELQNYIDVANRRLDPDILSRL